MPQAGFPLISQPLKGNIPAPLIYLFISLFIIYHLFHSSINRASPSPNTLHLNLCYKRHWGRGLGDFLCTVGLYRQCPAKLSPSPRTLFRVILTPSRRFSYHCYTPALFGISATMPQRGYSDSDPRRRSTRGELVPGFRKHPLALPPRQRCTNRPKRKGGKIHIWTDIRTYSYPTMWA